MDMYLWPSLLTSSAMARPTITIDTSAVSNISPPQDMESDAVALRAISNTSSTLQGEPSSPLSNDGIGSSNANRPRHSSHHSQASRTSIRELRASTSFDSRERDSRPTSPHNVSSPASRWGDKSMGFLAVPGSRSRQNSIESDEGSHAKTDYSGETFANSSSQGDKDRMFGKAPGNDDIMNDPEALMPDPGTEQEFEVQDNSFAFSQGHLNKLINPKNLSAFYALGGLAGLEKGLRTDRRAGLSVDESDLDGTVTFEEARAAARKNTPPGYDSKAPLSRVDSKESSVSVRRPSPRDIFYDRKRVYKDNRLPVKKGKNLLQLMWITYNDKVLILLSIAAAISLAVGLYQTFGTQHDAENPPIEWVEGVAIIGAIVIVVVVGSLNDWQKERQFVKLNKKKQDRNVNVVRSGKTREISVFDVLVGDVMYLEPGDMIPVDGIFIEGHNVKCDESQTTGESDLLRKHPADEVYAAIENHDSLRKLDPFILSGAQVTDGVGTFLVTSTGVNSSYGKTLMSLREDPEVTPLQSKLNTLAEYIAKLGGAAGLILFIVLFIEFLVRLPHNTGTPTEKGQDFLQIFIVTITIIVVAVPEGLPLAVTLALAFATTRMLKDNNLVRHLKACEVMGNATTVCSDKTGTLTENKMTVVAGTLGTSSRFGGTVDTSNTEIPNGNSKGKQTQQEATENVSPQEVVASLSQGVKSLLKDSIAINSTAFEGEVDGVKSFLGSKTETALLTFAKEFLGMESVDQERSNATIVQLVPFDSSRKCMGVVLQLDDKHYRLYVKGASEILLEKCSSIVRDPTREPANSHMTEDNRQTLTDLINNYASRSLRTIALVYRDFDKWPPRGARTVEGESDEAVFEDIFTDMVLLSIVGIQDPLREGVAEAVAACQKAGVVVRMVTGDNMVTARAIATECGIYTKGGAIMEGPVFRKLSKTQMDQVIPRLQVLARSSPKDKQILVRRLKELGETVAVTGDGTNDAPALKTADVGFSMGISGTEVAKEASAIILMDDNFKSIVKAMMWGRAVNDAVKKFLQFQVTVNITAVLLTFITAVASADEQSVLTAVQLLWVNLIMDTMAALALATDPPTESILDRKPDPKSAPLITITMWKMIIGEALYQLAITLLLNYGSYTILSYQSPREHSQVPTLVFNTFVWMQIFNQWK
jgi:Ca2+-transporting ATPase